MPVPEAVVILKSRDSPLYEGTSFSLTCVITPNMTGVDITDFEIEINFTGPVTFATDRIENVTSLNDTQISLTFSPLIMNATGLYECSVMVYSALPNVTASDSEMNDTVLSILRKLQISVAFLYNSQYCLLSELPAPEVAIHSAIPLPTAGENHTLLCSTIAEEYLITSPVLKWIFIESIPDISESSSFNSSSWALIFHPLHTSHGGPYTCQATLNIPEAGITNLTSSNTENITVQSK